jgi:hypothetical protein
MKLTKRALDTLDTRIERIYRAHHCGVEIPLLGIGQIFRNARNAATPHILHHAHIEAALSAAHDDMTRAINDTVRLITTPNEVSK